MADKISIRELARRINVSDTAVHRALKGDKLSDCYDPAAKKFDWKKAKKNEWVQSAEVIKPQRGVSAAKAVEKIDNAENKDAALKKNSVGRKDLENNNPIAKPGTSTEEGENIDELSEEELADRIKLTDTMTIQQALRAKEIFTAAMDKIKLKQLQGILVPKADVEKAYFTHAAQLKSGLLQIPEIISDDLLAANNKIDVINLLKKTLVGVLEKYSKAPDLKTEE